MFILIGLPKSDIVFWADVGVKIFTIFVLIKILITNKKINSFNQTVTLHNIADNPIEYINEKQKERRIIMEKIKSFYDKFKGILLVVSSALIYVVAILNLDFIHGVLVINGIDLVDYVWVIIVGIGILTNTNTSDIIKFMKLAKEVGLDEAIKITFEERKSIVAENELAEKEVKINEFLEKLKKLEEDNFDVLELIENGCSLIKDDAIKYNNYKIMKNKFEKEIEFLNGVEVLR